MIYYKGRGDTTGSKGHKSIFAQKADTGFGKDGVDVIFETSPMDLGGMSPAL